MRLAGEYDAIEPGGTTSGFLAWLNTTVKSEAPDTAGDAVEVVTFHRAKGLEWPVVFIAGLERGLVPIGHATTPAAEAEERRLLYVALDPRPRSRCAARGPSGARFGCQGDPALAVAVSRADRDDDRPAGQGRRTDRPAREDRRRA